MKYIRFDDMTWPLDELHNEDSLAWRLRYGPLEITQIELLQAASILDAYWALIFDKTQKERNHICTKLKESNGVVACKEKGGA